MKSYTLFILLLMTSSCSDNSDKNLILSQISLPEDCCISGFDLQILEDSLNSSDVVVYLANVMMSDVKNRGQMYFPQTNDKVKIIESFKVIDEDNVVVFENTNFQPNQSDSGWDGKINGKDVEGKFIASMLIRGLDGSLLKFDKIFCNLICSKGARHYIDEGVKFRNCRWPNQHDGNGSIDTTKPVPCP